MDDDFVTASQMANDAFASAEQVTVGPISFDGALPLQAQQPNISGSGQPLQFQVINDPLHGRHGKLITDPVHGIYRLDPACIRIFDTRAFQRLRRLKQLGMAYFVFPGACHNRFEHSLGVAHLAYRLSHQLSQAQPELEVDRGDIQVVTLAGLCHDLGHGPFSHVFDREFLRRKGIVNWEHEEMSSKMLDLIIDENNIDIISNDDVARIKELIMAGHTAPPPSPDGSVVLTAPSATSTQSQGQTKRWLGEIVANGRNSIDVDKFDYLCRDAHSCGVKIPLDFNRIMQFSRVIGDEICYKYTEYMNLYELFQTRAAMHRKVYTHRKSKAIEFMVVDALIEAEPALKITEKIHNAADFVRLDDGIIDMIENLDVLGPLVTLDEGNEASIRSAQKIIARLRNRQLYKYVTDAPIPTEDLEAGQWKLPEPQEIISHYRGNDVKLNIDEVIVHENKIDYSMKNKNPLDSVNFYDSLWDNRKRKLQQEQISQMVVQSFEEKRIRIYSRNPDPRVVNALHQAFENWLTWRWRGAVEASTPAKPLRPPPDAAGMPILGNRGVKRGRNLFGEGEGPPLPPRQGPRQ